MCCSLLSMLEGILEKDKIRLLEQYFAGLDRNTSDKITTIKIMQALDIDSKTAKKVLMTCKKNGILSISYAIRCPECGFIIKILDDMPLDLKEFEYCYACEEDITLELSDIELIFSLVRSPSCFAKGQCLENVIEIGNKKENRSVAPENTLKSFLDDGQFSMNSLLYAPKPQEFEKMEELYEKVKKASSKNEKGSTLECLIKYIMSLVCVFKAGDFRTKTNQFDCFVRNTSVTNVGVLEFIGGRFIIECKNESKTPSGTYMLKLHDIISLINNDLKIIKFGIIVSMKKAPKTFMQRANAYYLKEKTIIISIDNNDLDSIILEHENLLDIIEQKCTEVVCNATSDLRAAGLF